MPGKIFISYRRDDQPAFATILRDRLAAIYGHDSVFMDVAHLLPGEDFAERLRHELAGCDVLLAVIGPRWLELLDARAASHERDFVRSEIATALERRIIVVPVLIGNANVPPANRLPEDLQHFVFRQKHDLNLERIDRDTTELVKAIDNLRQRQRAADETSLLSVVPPVRPSTPRTAAFAAFAVACLGVGAGIATWRLGLPAGFGQKPSTTVAVASEPRCPPGALTMGDLRVMSAENVVATAAGRGPPVSPFVKALASNIMKSYACKSIVNFYAAKLGMPDDIVKPRKYDVESSVEFVFGNLVNANVCGFIRFDAKQLPTESANKGTAGVFSEFIKRIISHSMTAEEEIFIEIDNFVQRFLPDGKYLAKPSTQNLEKVVAAYQNQLIDNYNAFIDRQRWTSVSVAPWPRCATRGSS